MTEPYVKVYVLRHNLPSFVCLFIPTFVFFRPYMRKSKLLLQVCFSIPEREKKRTTSAVKKRQRKSKVRRRNFGKHLYGSSHSFVSKNVSPPEAVSIQRQEHIRAAKEWVAFYNGYIFHQLGTDLAKLEILHRPLSVGKHLAAFLGDLRK